MKPTSRQVLTIIEYFLLAAVLFYWASTTWFNPIAIVLCAIMVCQLIFKNRIIGIVIPTILGLLSFYMILALIAEVNEFPAFNSEAKTMLFVGLSIFISIIAVSGVMFFKYLTNENVRGLKN